MNEFLVEDEKDKEETVGIYVDLEGATSTWHMANNNRKRIKELEGAVAALTVLVIIVFFITLVLTVAIIWEVI